jgi:hypothetical protein
VRAVNIEPTHEHEWEAAPGLPAPLPAGEVLLWQGAPDWRQLALHAFHVRKIALYFSLMLAVQTAHLLGDGATGSELWRPLSVSVLTACLALALLTGVAWFAGRTALYTLTNKRVVMRIGIVLTLTFNLPYRRIAAASLRHYGKGSLDIALQLYPQDRIGWFHLWPHQRAWQLRHPQPTLRCLLQGESVCNLLIQQWQLAHAHEAVLIADPAAPTAAPDPRLSSARRPSQLPRTDHESQQGLPA